jgi:transcriptional regulator with XRE-family HTH domain
VTEIVNTPGYRRRRLAGEARRLRDAGLLQREIQERLGVSRAYVSELLNDPDGTAAKRRKQRYAGVCVDCGAPTSGARDAGRSRAACSAPAGGPG